ncbi:type II secretion system protein N [Marinobacterium litorale]|uniref:type II secretion system protein N n=1 Tax=Marinobacterium litorale TaxID=404770 RepID=UPI00047F879F|nr:type II secretion system protein N [Marinobacterium litorale]
MRLKSILWSGCCLVAGGTVFTGTLLAGVPLSYWAEQLELPRDLELETLQGSLIQGQIDRVAGPGWQLEDVNWYLAADWPLTARGGFAISGQRWQLHLSGWPWRWRADVVPQPGQWVSRGASQSPFSWAGQWQGAVQLEGRANGCAQAQGAFVSNNLRLQTPLVAPFGQVTLTLDCQAGLLLRAQTRGEGQQLNFVADLAARRSRLNGHIRAGSPLAEPARTIGLNRGGGEQIQRGWRW